MADRRNTLAAILTDPHFWVPAIVLVIGIVMLLVIS
ncbi:MAG: translocated intimin receptor Tir [Acidobacteria bacterium]|nr:translocated intimin receptor Tir [Acidobacteriota bacterium]